MPFGVIRKLLKEKQDLTNVDVNVEEVPIPAHPGPIVEPPPPVVDLKFDIDLKDPETIKAATLIQAGFRSLGARRDISKMHKAASRIQAGFRSKQTRVILNTMKTALNTDFTDSSSEESSEEDDVFGDKDMQDYAATKIQAGFRGNKARKEVKELKENIIEHSNTTAATAGAPVNPGADPKAEAESITSQSVAESAESSKYTPGYFELHGIETQSEQEDNTLADNTLSSMKTHDLATSGSVKDGQKMPIPAKTPEEELAATKIQAGYRGIQARKEVEQLKLERNSMPNNQDSVTSVRGSDDEDTIKENLTEKSLQLDKKDAKPNDLHNSNAPVAGTNGVDKSHAESEEPEDIETEFLEEDLQDDWTESSASVSEKSANAPIRNKKVPFGVIRKILKKLTTPKNRVGDHDDSVFQKRDRIDRSNDNSQASEKSTGSGTTSQKNSKQMVKRSGKVEPTISAEEKQTNER